MKVGVYLRVSTEIQVQRGESLDEQLDEARSYCKYKGVSIVDTYREEGKSGKNTDRPELQRLLRDCKKGKIDTVIVKKLDRLSRSILDFEKMLRFFEEHHIALISLKESFDTSNPMSMAAVRIILVFAQLEREQTSERIRDAMMFRAKRGIWHGGSIPLGYDYITKKGLIVNEEEKKQVVYTFQKYVELGSCMKVAQHLNALGYRTKRFKTKKGIERGGVMQINSNIARTIQNPMYIGKMLYKSERYSGMHEAIIPEDLFNQAQAIRKENRRRRGNVRKENKHNFLLEGLIKCGECGSQMSPRWAMGKSQRYFYYGCTKVSHRGKDSCSIRRISAPAIEQLILNSLRTLTKDDALFQEVMAGNDEAARRRVAELRQSERDLEARIAAIEHKARTIAGAFAEAIANDREHVIALEMERLDKERKETIQRQTEARIEANDLETKTISKEAARQTLTAFTEVYGTLSPFDKKALMAQLIHSITFTKEKVTIRYYVLPDLDILIKQKAPQTGGPVSQRLLLGGPFKEQNKTILITLNIETYKGKDGKVMLRILRGKSNESNLPESEGGRESEAAIRPSRSEAGQSPCEERAV